MSKTIKNKTNRIILKSSVNILVLSLIVSLNWLGLFTVGETVAYYFDIEVSHNNLLAADDLDFIVDSDEEVCQVWKTYTQGGWGAKAKGNNPGTYRDANFSSAFPTGAVIGNASGFKSTFTTATAVKDFLPAGGTPNSFNQNYTNPNSTSAGVLAGQALALTLSLGFDNYDENFSPSELPLAGWEISGGPSQCNNKTVQNILDETNKVLAGLPSVFSSSQANECATYINERFDGGKLSCDDEGNSSMCSIYAVNDAGSSDSQFLKIKQSTFVASTLGPQYNDYDIEGLDMHPTTGALYASAGSGGTANGNVYTVDKQNGSLTLVGNTGFSEIVALSFRDSDQTLWGWSENTGLIKINTLNGSSSLVLSSSVNIEGLAWNNSSSLLYASSGNKLYVYNPLNDTLTLYSSNLPGTTEALEMLPDGTLLGGVHNNNVTLFIYNVDSKTVVFTTSNTEPYADIEGIAWDGKCGLPQNDSNNNSLITENSNDSTLDWGESNNLEATVTEVLDGVDWKYRVRAEQTSGYTPFCNVLNIEAFLNGDSVYNGDLMSFISPTAQFTPLDDDWKFIVKIPQGAPYISMGKICNYDFIFEGWQNEFPIYPNGFNDIERLENEIQSGTYVSPIVINEFLPNPTGADDNTMPFGEWVELYNNSSNSLDLAGWYLYDNSNSHPLEITSSNSDNNGNTGDAGETIIPANGYLVVYLNQAYSGGWLNNSNSDKVRLYNGSIAGGTLIDQYSYSGSVPSNKSYARIPDGIGDFVDPIPTPLSANVLDEPIVLIDSVAVNQLIQEEIVVEEAVTQEATSPIVQENIIPAQSQTDETQTQADEILEEVIETEISLPEENIITNPMEESETPSETTENSPVEEIQEVAETEAVLPEETIIEEETLLEIIEVAQEIQTEEVIEEVLSAPEAVELEILVEQVVLEEGKTYDI